MSAQAGCPDPRLGTHHRRSSVSNGPNTHERYVRLAGTYFRRNVCNARPTIVPSPGSVSYRCWCPSQRPPLPTMGSGRSPGQRRRCSHMGPGRVLGSSVGTSRRSDHSKGPQPVSGHLGAVLPQRSHVPRPSEPASPSWTVAVPLVVSAFSRSGFKGYRTTGVHVGGREGRYFVTVNVAVTFCGPLPAGPKKVPETL